MQEITVGVAPVKALRVNFVGELGWELHHSLAYQLHLWDKIWEASQEFDIRPFGIRAMDSLRIEKSYRHWKTDLSTEYSPLESGCNRFVHLNKGEFVGREKLVAQQQKGLPYNFVTIEVEAKDSDPWGNEPLYDASSPKTMVGRATSGAYGYTLGKSYAVGHEKPSHAAPGTKLEIIMLGERHKATTVAESPWDPDNARLRA
jgi:dimethylglycine dehydrogenase